MRPPQKASHGRQIFKVKLVGEMEGSLYGACVCLFLKARFVTDHDTNRSPLPESPVTQPSDQTSSAWRPAVVEAASQDSLLSGEEVMHTDSQLQAINGMSTSRTTQIPPQQDLQPRHRMPLVIRQLPPPPPNLDIPSNAADFPFNFLRSSLRGRLQPPCCYVNTDHTTTGQVYPVKAWYAIDAEEEPFLPPSPGKHGAKLTLFMPEVSEADDYDPKEALPLFVKRGRRGYVYFGTYSQSRYSDRLSYAEMELEVQRSVKEDRAKEVGRSAKPKWIADAMKWERIVETDKEAQTFGPADILRAFQRVSYVKLDSSRPLPAS